MKFEPPFVMDQHKMWSASVARREEVEHWLERNGIRGKYYKSITAFGRRARLVTAETDSIFEVQLRELPPDHWTPWFD